VWGIEKRIPILFVVSSNPAAHCVSLSLSFSLLKPTAIFGLYVDGLLFVYMPTDLCVSTVDRERVRERGRKEEEEKEKRIYFDRVFILYTIYFFGGWSCSLHPFGLYFSILIVLLRVVD
jgi:hypothetical protein